MKEVYTQHRSAYRWYDYYINDMLVEGDNPIYTVIKAAGGPNLEITKNNGNAYKELEQGSGEWKPFTYNGHTIERVLLPYGKKILENRKKNKK